MARPPEENPRATFVVRMALTLVFADLAILASIPLWKGRDTLGNGLFQAASGYLIAALAAYLLARRGNAEIAANLVVGGMAVGTWAYALLQWRMEPLAVSVIGVGLTSFLSAVLITPRAAAAVGIGNLAGVSVLAGVSGRFDVLTGEVFVHLFAFGALGFAAALLRHQDLHRITSATDDIVAHLAELDAVVASGRDGLAVLDDSQRIVRCNEAFTRLLDITESPVGTHLVDHVRAPDLERQLTRSVVERLELEWECVIPTDPPRHIEMRLAPLNVDRRRNWLVATFEDVTRRKEAEEARREAAARARQVVVNIVSHELRTPLTPLMLDLHMLKNELLGPLNDRQKSTLARMDGPLQRLMGVLGSISRFTRMQGAGTGSPRVCRVAETLGKLDPEVVAKVEALIAAEDSVVCDPQVLREVLAAVLELALKQPPVRVWMFERRGEIHVRGGRHDGALDTPPDPFASDDPPDDFHRSLVLFMVSLAIQANDGRVTAGQSPGGIHVCITLPAPTRQPSPPA